MFDWWNEFNMLEDDGDVPDQKSRVELFRTLPPGQNFIYLNKIFIKVDQIRGRVEKTGQTWLFRGSERVEVF